MNYLIIFAVFMIGEAVAVLIFKAVRKRYDPSRAEPLITSAAGRGILERAVLYTGLLFGFPHILIAFGALKLGTRLHDEQDNQISNSYFLVGNLISIFLAMLYAIITKSIWTT